MALPDISHQQFVALSALFNKEASGEELRAVFSDHKVKRTNNAFYAFMARMEEDGLVTSEYAEKRTRGYFSNEKIYKITPKGKKLRQECLDFYKSFE